jgi:hypothetical protein
MHICAVYFENSGPIKLLAIAAGIVLLVLGIYERIHLGRIPKDEREKFKTE